MDAMQFANTPLYSTSAASQSTTSGGDNETASCVTHITLPCELDHTTRTEPSSTMDDQLSLDPSLDRSLDDSTNIPQCSSTQCNTPVENTAEKTFSTPPPLHAVLPAVHSYGAPLPQVYNEAAEDADVRARIAVNAKQLFHTLTGFSVDETLDLLYVRETWFSTEALIHALCLVNRISLRYPHWRVYNLESDTEVSSHADSPIRGYSNARHGGFSLPHVCSSTSSDASPLDALDEMSDTPREFMGRSLARSSSASTNSLGDVFTRSNSQRCIMAILLLSSKFHGDIVYNTASLARAVNTYREEKKKQLTKVPARPADPHNKPLLRVEPATLGQCEKRLFHELGCTVFVHKEEYQCCEAMVLKGM